MGKDAAMSESPASSMLHQSVAVMQTRLFSIHFTSFLRESYGSNPDLHWPRWRVGSQCR